MAVSPFRLPNDSIFSLAAASATMRAAKSESFFLPNRTSKNRRSRPENCLFWPALLQVPVLRYACKEHRKLTRHISGRFAVVILQITAQFSKLCKLLKIFLLPQFCSLPSKKAIADSAFRCNATNENSFCSAITSPTYTHLCSSFTNIFTLFTTSSIIFSILGSQTPPSSFAHLRHLLQLLL